MAQLVQLGSSDCQKIRPGDDDALQRVVRNIAVVRDRWPLGVDIEMSDVVNLVDIGDDPGLASDRQRSGWVITYFFTSVLMVRD